MDKLNQISIFRDKEVGHGLVEEIVNIAKDEITRNVDSVQDIDFTTLEKTLMGSMSFAGPVKKIMKLKEYDSCLNSARSVATPRKED